MDIDDAYSLEEEQVKLMPTTPSDHFPENNFYSKKAKLDNMKQIYQTDVRSAERSQTLFNVERERIVSKYNLVPLFGTSDVAEHQFFWSNTVCEVWRMSKGRNEITPIDGYSYDDICGYIVGSEEITT